MMKDRYITLAHDNVGRFMRELIDEFFARHLADPSLYVTLDAAPIGLAAGMETVVTTDGFTVKPLEFPGGNIGAQRRGSGGGGRKQVGASQRGRRACHGCP